MAACYEAIRRFDLAESKYEAALALDPHNPALLNRLAAALDQQGKAQAAAEVRGEVADLAAASKALDDARAEPEPAAASLAPAQTVTVALPKAPAQVAVAKPVPQNPELAAATGLAEPSSRMTAAQLAVASRTTMAAGVMANLNAAPLRDAAPYILQPAQPAQPAKPVPPVQLAGGSRPDLVAELLRRMNAAPLQDSVPQLLRPASPAKVASVSISAKPVPTMAGPRLERLSLGEVALLTTTAPVWRAQVVAATPQKVTVRWVPLNVASARPNIRLLNAARAQGLAARNRDYLLDRGWRKIEIGDAADVRERSLVLYPAARPALGRSLAAQFGFRAQPTTTSEVFVIFLGRDAAALKAASAKG
jgi:hypothetical protein